MNKKTFWIRLVLFLAAFSAAAVTLVSEARYRTERSISIPDLGVVIRTLVVSVPETPAGFIFDGTEHTVDLYPPEGVVVGGTVTGTNAGTYEIEVSLADPDTMVWTDGTNGPKIIPWQIYPRPVPIPTVTDRVQIYTGDVLRPTVTGFDSVYARVSGTAETADAGHHSMVFSLADPANTRWADGSTAEIREDWSANVCRIGEIYYPSVTEAFGTERSTAEMPVELLVDWAENAVNANGEDWLTLNGHTLSSDGVTVENRASLTVLGNGTFAAAGSGDRNHTPLLNSGTLVVKDGEFTAEYTGEATGGSEVYGLWNVGGETVIEGGTFTVSGKSLAADALYVSDGKVTVTDGEFTVSTECDNHGAYALWMDGGEAEIAGGTFSVTIGNFDGSACFIAAGTAEISGGSISINGEAAPSVILFAAAGTGHVGISGGSHHLTGTSGNVIAAANGGSATFSGGEILAEFGGDSTALVNGFLVDGGSGEMSGGTLRIVASAADEIAGIGAYEGEMTVTGGRVEIRAAGTAVANGLTVYQGVTTVSALEVDVWNPGDQASGMLLTGSGSLTVYSGNLTVGGDVASTGDSTVGGHPIENRAEGEDLSFHIYYGSGWSAGTNWTRAPYVVSAEPLSERPPLTAGRREAGETDPGEEGDRGLEICEIGAFYVTGSELFAAFRNADGGEIEWSFGAAPGLWTVRRVLNDEGTTFVAEAVAYRDPAADPETSEEELAKETFCEAELVRGYFLLGPLDTLRKVRGVRKSYILEQPFGMEETARGYRILSSPVGAALVPTAGNFDLEIAAYREPEGPVVRFTWQIRPVAE